MRRILVQSHRGGGLLTPENTLDSFIATWDLGAVPEADLRTTRDGVIVAFHDSTFARLVAGVPSELRDKGVQDVTFQELASLDVGAWKHEKFAGQRICSLAQIFSLLHGHPDRALYMDIKDVHLPQLAGLVRDYNVEKQVIFAAPDEKLLRDWRSLMPHSETLLWIAGEETLQSRLQRLQSEDFAGITQLQIHVQAIRNQDHWHFKPSLECLREIAGRLKTSGVLFQALPWERAEAELYRALLSAGVQSFASDYPEVALRVLKEWLEVER